MRIFSACLFYILIISFWARPTIAHTVYDFGVYSEGEVNEALEKTVPFRFLPSHPLYFLISVKETFDRFLKPSARERAQFDLVLSGKRLKEVYKLLEKNDIKNASRGLMRYAKRSDNMLLQFEKARGQNQDIGELVGIIADTLQYHEVLLSAVNKKWQEKEEGYSFDTNFSKAVEGFKGAILAVDGIRPGIKDRFGITKKEEE